MLNTPRYLEEGVRTRLAGEKARCEWKGSRVGGGGDWRTTSGRHDWVEVGRGERVRGPVHPRLFDRFSPFQGSRRGPSRPGCRRETEDSPLPLSVVCGTGHDE